MHTPFEPHKQTYGKTCSHQSISVSRAGLCAVVPSQPLLLARRASARQGALATHQDRRGLGRHAAPVAPFQPSRVTALAPLTTISVPTFAASGKFTACRVAASGVLTLGRLQPISLPNPSVERDGQPAALVGSLRSFAAPAAPHLTR